MCTGSEREKWYYVVCVCVHVDVRTQNNFFLFLNRERYLKYIYDIIFILHGVKHKSLFNFIYYSLLLEEFRWFSSVAVA